MLLKVLKSRETQSLADLIREAELFATPSQVRDTVRELVAWELVVARRGNQILAPNQLNRFSLRDRPQDLTLSVSARLAEIEAAFAYALDAELPIFGPPQRRFPGWTDLFVVMPFAAEMKPVLDLIQDVAGRLGLSVARGDNFFTVQTIMAMIWSAINAARVIVADCTDRNPNVFYEIGIAHTLGKPTILLAQSIADVPFDLRHLPVILYESPSEGMEKLGIALDSTLRSVLGASIAGR